MTSFWWYAQFDITLQLLPMLLGFFTYKIAGGPPNLHVHAITRGHVINECHPFQWWSLLPHSKHHFGSISHYLPYPYDRSPVTPPMWSPSIGTRSNWRDGGFKPVVSLFRADWQMSRVFPTLCLSITFDFAIWHGRRFKVIVNPLTSISLFLLPIFLCFAFDALTMQWICKTHGDASKLCSRSPCIYFKQYKGGELHYLPSWILLTGTHGLMTPFKFTNLSQRIKNFKTT